MVEIRQIQVQIKFLMFLIIYPYKNPPHRVGAVIGQFISASFLQQQLILVH